jgi:hypothetical protein
LSEEAKKIEAISYYTISISLVYILIGLLSGFFLVYMIMSGSSIPGLMTSAHSHFLCMSTITLIIGVAMNSWASQIREERFSLTGGFYRAAQVSIILLALGNIMAFVFYLAQMTLPGLIGDILYFIGFLMAAMGWIMGGRKVK